MNKKVYIGTSLRFADLAKRVAERFESAKWNVVCRWFDEDHDRNDAVVMRDLSNRQVEAVKTADVTVILLADSAQRGAHTEFGTAIGVGSPIVLWSSGKREQWPQGDPSFYSYRDVYRVVSSPELAPMGVLRRAEEAFSVMGRIETAFGLLRRAIEDRRAAFGRDWLRRLPLGETFDAIDAGRDPGKEAASLDRVDLNAIGAEIKAWRDANLGPSTRAQSVIKILEELGEAARAVTKKREGIRESSRGNLDEELADIILTTVALAADEGIDVNRALRVRIARAMELDFKRFPDRGRSAMERSPAETLANISWVSNANLFVDDSGRLCLDVVIRDGEGETTGGRLIADDGDTAEDLFECALAVLRGDIMWPESWGNDPEFRISYGVLESTAEIPSVSIDLPPEDEIISIKTGIKHFDPKEKAPLSPVLHYSEIDRVNRILEPSGLYFDMNRDAEDVVRATLYQASPEGFIPSASFTANQVRLICPEPGLPGNLLSSGDARELGIIQEVNRRLLHPRGLALYIVWDKEWTDGKSVPARLGILDYRSEPDGMAYKPGHLSGLGAYDKAARFEDLLDDERRLMREIAIGSVIQPVSGARADDRTDDPGGPKEPPSPFVSGAWACRECDFVRFDRVITPNGIGVDGQLKITYCPNDGTGLVRATEAELEARGYEREDETEWYNARSIVDNEISGPSGPDSFGGSDDD